MNNAEIIYTIRYCSLIRKVSIATQICVDFFKG